MRSELVEGIGIGRIENTTDTFGNQVTENDQQNAGGANQSINRLLGNGPKVRVMLITYRTPEIPGNNRLFLAFR